MYVKIINDKSYEGALKSSATQTNHWMDFQRNLHTYKPSSLKQICPVLFFSAYLYLFCCHFPKVGRGSEKSEVKISKSIEMNFFAEKKFEP